MSRPGRVLLWMLSFLGLLGLAVAALIEPLSEAFLSNPVFNAVTVYRSQLGQPGAQPPQARLFAATPAHFSG